MKLSRGRTKRWSAAVLGAAIGLASSDAALAKKQAEPPVEYGPVPTWDRFRELAEQTIRARLVDPDSAKFSWIWGFQQGFYKPMLLKRVHGYYGCGFVNARNRMGGYTGNRYFIVVIDNDMVRFAELADNDYSMIGDQCVKAKLPPLTQQQQQQGLRTPKPTYGIAFFMAPEGIKVDRVFPGSPSELAGIKSGMVIARINGLELKGLSQSTAEQILAGLTGNAVMELASGAVITVKRP